MVRSPTVDDLAALLDVARAAARAAGELLITGYRTHPAFELKSRANLVTRFDRESEALLGRMLRETGIPVFGEELGGETGEATFYVDPLDGTTNFAHGHPFFCVSIGLVERGVARLGVVLAPALGVEWSGAPSVVPSTRNGAPCRVSEVSELDAAMIATGFPSVREDRDFEAFLATKRVVQAVRRCGAAAIDMCLVADGTYEAYFERKLNPWDFAGAAAIVAGAGGRLSSPSGGPVDLFSGALVASNGLVHDALLRVLAPTDFATTAV